ncbi:MAG: N-acetyltransferase [Actinomycetota bacterium]
MTVRTMRAEEYPPMRAVSVEAFDDADIGTLLDALRESWCWRDELSFVAELDGEIVGHVLYTSAIVDAPAALVDVLVLSPIGVRRDLHGRGIGGRLITETLPLLRDRPEPVVFLEGSPAYYPRFGFRPGAELGFVKPSDRIPDPAFQVRPLGDLPDGLSGRLVYPDAFWRTDSVGLR